MIGLLPTSFIFFSLILSSTAILDADLVVSFFNYKSIQSGYVFDCLSTKDRVQFVKFLMSHYLRISQRNINHNSVVINIQFKNLYGIVADGDCSNINDLFQQAKRLKLFHDTQRWLIIAYNDTILSNLINLPLNINSDLYVAFPVVDEQSEVWNWTIVDVYNPAFEHSGSMVNKTIGFYNALEGFNVNIKENKYWLRRNMTGTNFKTMLVFRQTLNVSFEEYVHSDENRRIDTFTRFHCRLIHYCRDFYNFSMKVLPTDSWGYEISKGNFDGMVGALKDKAVDFGCMGLYVKRERLPVLSYAKGMWTFRVVIIFRQPRILSFGRVFLQPMSTPVWLSTLAAALLVLVTLKASQRYEINVVKIVSSTLDHAWSTLILFILGAFCQQGYSQNPHLACGRIISLSVLIFCLLFYQFYSGTIVSFLLTKPPPMIQTSKDLLESPLEFGSDNAPYVIDFFHTTKDPVAVDLYNQKILKPGNNSNYYLPECGMKMVQDSAFAYQVEIVTGYVIVRDTFSNKAVCELGEIEMFPPMWILSPLQKNSPFRDMLNYCMLRLHEHGIGHRQKLFWGAQKPECLESSNSIEIEVGLKEIYPAMLLLLVGILTSLVILMFEFLKVKRLKNKLGSNTELIESKFPFHN